MATRKAPQPIVESLAIGVPPARAWEALITPRILGDIVLGHVEMDSRPGRPFVWSWKAWAAAVPKSVKLADTTWRGTILDAVPGSTLILGGAGESTAVFTVKGDAAASLVTVVQAAVPRGIDIEDYRYGWADFLLALKTHLEPPPFENAVFLRRLIRATPAQITAAWLSAATMSKLLPGKVKIQASTGGRFEWLRKQPNPRRESGAFIEIVKGHRIIFSWQPDGARPAEVRLSAEATPYGALVSLAQLNPAQPGRNPEAERRMWAHLLERLRAYFFFGKKIRV